MLVVVNNRCSDLWWCALFIAADERYVEQTAGGQDATHYHVIMDRATSSLSCATVLVVCCEWHICVLLTLATATQLRVLLPCSSGTATVQLVITSYYLCSHHISRTSCVDALCMIAVVLVSRWQLFNHKNTKHCPLFSNCTGSLWLKKKLAKIHNASHCSKSLLHLWRTSYFDQITLLLVVSLKLLSCHIIPILRSLHWLRITVGKWKELVFNEFKFSQLPNLLTFITSPFNVLIELALHLSLLLLGQRHPLNTTYCCFCYASPCLWNRLPLSLRQPHSGTSY